MASRQLAARRFFSTLYRWNQLTCAITPRRHIRAASATITNRWFSRSAFSLGEEEATGPAAKNGLETTEMAGGKAPEASASSESTVKSASLRRLMRHVPYPAVIVTAGSTSPDTGNESYQAMTVSSFNTVSLDPDPIISFNVRVPSRTLDAIQASGRFIVHVPSGTLGSSMLADAFSRNDAQAAFQELTQYGAQVYYHHHHLHEVRIPSIDHPDMLASLTCDIIKDKMINVNDHVIVIAKVKSIHNRGLRTMESPSGLMYMNHTYRVIGEDVNPHGCNGNASTPQESARFSMAELPCFPGPKEAEALRDAIQDYALKNAEIVFSSNARRARDTICKEFNLDLSAVGVNISQVVYNVGVAEGFQMSSDYRDHGSPEITRYTGSLSKQQIPEIVQQAKSTIEQNPYNLEMHYMNFLFACNINPYPYGSFPLEDLLDGFRQAGVLGPPKYTNASRALLEMAPLTVEKAEEAERRFRAAMRRRSPPLEFSKAYFEFPKLLKESDTDWAGAYLRPALHTLVVEHNPDRYNPLLFEFHGEVTAEQSKAIMDRVLNSVEALNVLRMHNYWVLEQLNVHPLTKFDLGFLKQKLRVARRKGGEEHMREVIKKIRTEYGLRIPPEDVAATTNRIRSFVEEDPSRAGQLGMEGVLKELGIYPGATMSYRGMEVPLKSNPLLTALLGEEVPGRSQSLIRKVTTLEAPDSVKRVALSNYRHQKDQNPSNLDVEPRTKQTQEPRAGEFSVKELGEFRFNEEDDAYAQEYRRFMNEEEPPADEAEAQPQSAPVSDLSPGDPERATLLRKFRNYAGLSDSEERN